MIIISFHLLSISIYLSKIIIKILNIFELNYYSFNNLNKIKNI